METMRTRKFRYTYRHSPDDFAGLIDTTTTETLTEKDGGVLVETVVTGTHEGSRVNEKASRFAANADFDRACEYRLTHGYQEVR